MSKMIDLTGQTFGKWTVVRFNRMHYTTNDNQTLWLCRCECGAEREVGTGNLRSGHSTQCAKCRAASKTGLTHGGSYTPLYNVWSHRKSRKQLIDRWSDDYAIFRNEATGYKQGLILKPIRRDELIGPGNFVWRPLNDIEADVERTMEIMGDDSLELKKRLMGVTRQRRHQLRNKARGLCTFCGKPSVSARFCLKHLLLNRERDKIKSVRKRQKKKETKL